MRWRGVLVGRLLFLGAIIVAMGAALQVQAAPPSAPLARPQTLSLGGVAPALNVRRLAGTDPVELDRLHGRVVVLDFWATWCRPCRTVMPALDGLHRDLHGRGLTVIGVTTEPAAMVQGFLQRNPVGYTVASGSSGTMARYRVRGLPTMVVIDTRGKVRRVMVGGGRAEMRALEGLVQSLLPAP
ncbi:MAG: TlpA family protein disulfide reductase [Myxococcales bacterium]|nr:TlpA family protein disulfide reductase [Myxococcales bacterium]